MPGYIVANSARGSGARKSWRVCVAPAVTGCQDVRTANGQRYCCEQQLESLIRTNWPGIRIPSVQESRGADPGQATYTDWMPGGGGGATGKDGGSGYNTGYGTGYGTDQYSQQQYGTDPGKAVGNAASQGIDQGVNSQMNNALTEGALESVRVPLAIGGVLGLGAILIGVVWYLTKEE